MLHGRRTVSACAFQGIIPRSIVQCFHRVRSSERQLSPIFEKSIQEYRLWTRNHQQSTSATEEHGYQKASTPAYGVHSLVSELKVTMDE